MKKYNNCIKCAEDLITTREQTRAGFIEAALEKNRKALPYIEDAKTLKVTLKSATIIQYTIKGRFMSR